MVASTCPYSNFNYMHCIRARNSFSLGLGVTMNSCEKKKKKKNLSDDSRGCVYMYDLPRSDCKQHLKLRPISWIKTICKTDFSVIESRKLRWSMWKRCKRNQPYLYAKVFSAYHRCKHAFPLVRNTSLARHYSSVEAQRVLPFERDRSISDSPLQKIFIIYSLLWDISYG